MTRLNEKSALAAVKHGVLRVVQASVACGMLLLPSVTFAAPGDLGTLFQVNDDDPKANIPTAEQRNANPLEFGYYLQDLVARAQVPFHAGDFDKAVKYYEAVALVLPEQATAYSRLCIAYDRLKKPELALPNCAKAMSLPGARVMDHTGFLKLTLNQKQLTPEAVADVESSLTHLRGVLEAPAGQQAPGSLLNDPEVEAKVRKSLREQLKLGPEPEPEPSASAEVDPAAAPSAPPPIPDLPLAIQVELFECKLAALIRNAPRLERCIAALEKQKAEPRVVLGFKWSLAAVSKNETLLASVVDEARRLGVNDQAIETLKASYGSFSSEKPLPAAVAAAGLAQVAGPGAGVPESSTQRWLAWGLGLLGVALVGGFFGLRQVRRWRARELAS